MEVEVTGTPVPDVYWSKDDRPLLETNNISIKIDTNQRHRMVIAKVSQLDAGRYSIKAINRAGEAISTAELFVSAALQPSASESEQQSSPSLSRKHPPLKVDVTVRPSLQPEPAPELLFAPKSSETPASSSSSGRIDFAEKTRLLEEASKVISPTEVPGGIRLLPMPSVEEPIKVSTVKQKIVVDVMMDKGRRPSVELSKFERFPELEPFPFKADEPRVEQKKSAAPPIRKPNKFVKGDSRESDYESDLESTRILPRWAPPGSDTEDAGYKKVQPKLLASESERSSRAVSKEPTPPSQFDIPPEMEGPPRPVVLTEATVAALIESRMESTAVSSVVGSRPIVPSVAISPANPSPKPSPRALAMEKQWVPVKKTVEPTLEVRSGSSTPVRAKPSLKALEMEKQWSHRFAVSTSSGSKIWPPPGVIDPPRPSSTPIWAGQSISSASSTDYVTTSREETTTQQKSILKTNRIQQQQEQRRVVIKTTQESAPTPPPTPDVVQQQEPLILEPFPFKPSEEELTQSTIKTEISPLRKPGKFVAGGFTRESDYESDLESSRIAPRWAPPDSDHDEPTYRKVQPPPPTPIELRKQPEFVTDKIPSPPSKYDPNPPQFDGPPRPAFHPLDLSDQLPIPVPATPPQRKPSITGVETTRRMQMEESTQFSKRFVTVESTTKYVQLSAQQPQAPPPVPQQVLEPFPFVPDPIPATGGGTRRQSASSNPLASFRPSKFIPGTTESDYESDYDGSRIRPRWTPAGSETDEPRYRRVQVPGASPGGTLKRRDTSGARTPTPPTVFDQQPPQFDGPPRPVISPTDAIKIKSALQMSSSQLSSAAVIVKPKAIRPTPAPSSYINQNRPRQSSASAAVYPAAVSLEEEQRPTYGYAAAPVTASVARKLTPFIAV